jgi:hypothetical protein
MEKNVMRSMELVGRERMEVAVCPNRVNLELEVIPTNPLFPLATTLHLG